MRPQIDVVASAVAAMNSYWATVYLFNFILFAVLRCFENGWAFIYHRCRLRLNCYLCPIFQRNHFILGYWSSTDKKLTNKFTHCRRHRKTIALTMRVTKCVEFVCWKWRLANERKSYNLISKTEIQTKRCHKVPRRTIISLGNVLRALQSLLKPWGKPLRE